MASVTSGVDPLTVRIWFDMDLSREEVNSGSLNEQESRLPSVSNKTYLDLVGFTGDHMAILTEECKSMEVYMIVILGEYPLH